MFYEELVALFPCHSLEDFPLHAEGPEAEGLLAAWTVLWHPTLLAAVGALPTWYRADAPPENVAGRLIVVPPACESLLPAGWPLQAEADGATLVRKVRDRTTLLNEVLARLPEAAPAANGELAADFLALGFAYLQVELLTRQMRYMSNLDENRLKDEALAAARAATAGDEEATRRHLMQAFETLVEARERFYPVDNFLIDLTLVAPSTLGEAWRRELSSPLATNCLLTAEVAGRLAACEPATLEALRSAVDRGTACVLGGEDTERPLPLMHPEAIQSSLDAGLRAVAATLGAAPVVYGRRRAGLTPLLPQVLARFGFEGALHVTLDDGHFPTPGQPKCRWQGLDTATLDALGRVPLDAVRADAFLGLPRSLGEAMDYDRVATTIFAHWPGQVSPYYEDLRRLSRYAPVLGRFLTLAEYFRNTDQPGDVVRFTADPYRTPYLRQAIVRQEPDPVGRFALHHRRRVRYQTAATLHAWATAIRGPDAHHRDVEAVLSRARAMADDDCRLPGASVSNVPAAGVSDAEVDSLVAKLAASLAATVAGPPVASDSPKSGLVVFNPLATARRAVVDLSSLDALPAEEGPVVAVEQSTAGRRAVVEVPGFGFAVIRPTTAPPPRVKPPKPLAEAAGLRNDFMEVVLDETTGGIRGVYTPLKRGNHLSQQLGLRLPQPRPKPGDPWRDPDAEPLYSMMVAESREVVSTGPAVGEVVTRGRLLSPEGRSLARFEQRYRLPRGSRVLELEISLDVEEPPRADPWNSYYAARFAWASEAAELSRSVGLTRQTTQAKHLEAPHYVEIDDAQRRVAILTGGLPYHKVTRGRMLDTLLVARGDTARRFTLGVGLDVPQPAHEALSLLEPPVVASKGVAAGPSTAGWLWHCDARNLVATHWEPRIAGNRPTGFRVRLLETLGRSGRASLRSFRPLSAARQVDFRGQPLVVLQVDQDRILFDVGPHEWLDLEAEFAT